MYIGEKITSQNNTREHLQNPEICTLFGPGQTTVFIHTYSINDFFHGHKANVPICRLPFPKSELFCLPHKRPAMFLWDSMKRTKLGPDVQTGSLTLVF